MLTQRQYKKIQKMIDRILDAHNEYQEDLESDRIYDEANELYEYIERIREKI